MGRRRFRRQPVRGGLGREGADARLANLREAERAVGDARGARSRQRRVGRRDEFVEGQRGARVGRSGCGVARIPR